MDKPSEPILAPSLRSPDLHLRHANSLEEVTPSPDPAAARQIRPPACRIRPLLARSGRQRLDPPNPRLTPRFSSRRRDLKVQIRQRKAEIFSKDRLIGSLSG